MSYKCVVGDAVSFTHGQFNGSGVVRFVGSLLPNKKGLWVGIERDVPKSKELKDDTQPEGYNGKLGDMQYFTVKKGRGIFAPYDSVEVVIDNHEVVIVAKQTELRQIATKSEKEYSPAEDQKIQPDSVQSDTQRQLQKAQKLLEASLLLLQNGINSGSQLQQHCDESWAFLNKKCPPPTTPMLQENNMIADDEEKFVSIDVKPVTIGSYINDIQITQIKQILIDFMSRYSQSSNWSKSDERHYGEKVDSYVLMLDEHRRIEVRMSFLYSIILYLIQITGSNKRCIAHGAILIMPQKQQIETLSKEMLMILETLQHNNDDGLWKYVYTLISNIFTDFAYIQPYSGKRTALGNSHGTDNEENVSEDSQVLNSMFKLKALLTTKL